MTSQVLLNSVLSAITYVLVAAGFSLVWSSARFFHFAHGVVITTGAYATYAVMESTRLTITIALLCALGVSISIGCLMEYCVYRPLRHAGASPLNLLLASLGLYIVLQNLIAAVFGDDMKTIRRPISYGIRILGGRLTSIQILMGLVSIAVLGLLGIGLAYTRLGRSMRAVANDSQLAFSMGVNPDSINLISIAIGSGLAGLAGSLIALDVGATPFMGMNLLLYGVVAAIAGGMGKTTGLLFGALILGSLQHSTAWFVGPQWQDTIAFTLFILVLLIKPYGLFGDIRNKTGA